MNKIRRSPAARPVDNRSADTRRRLLEAGLRLFGRNGLEGVTTRDLSKAANVNLAAIPYHFGSKEGVYMAVADFIAEQLGPQFHAGLESLEAALADPKVSRKELIEKLADYTTSTLRTFAVSPLRLPVALFILREQIQPTAAFETVFGRVLSPALAIVDQMVSRLLDLPPDHPDVKITANMIWGEQFFAITTREALVRRMGWKDIGEAEVHKMAEVMATAIRRQFAAKH